MSLASIQPSLSVTVAQGKYTVVQHADGRLTALRYGEEWRDLTGDKLVLTLAQEVDNLRAALTRARDCHPSQKWHADIIDAALAGEPLPT